MKIGPIRLRVRDLGEVRRFYEDTLGLDVREGVKGGEEGLAVGATHGAEAGGENRAGFLEVFAPNAPKGDPPLLTLDGNPNRPLRQPGAPGLFHIAFLVPSRADLARILRRLSETGTRLQGASDHLVSEALYLADPEGNGIEIYADRPPEQWDWKGEEVAMATHPLDVDGLIEEAEGGASLPVGTRVGHLHLRGRSTERAEAFFHRGLGLRVTARSYPGALFFAAKGYHHHLALNRWGMGGGAPEVGSPRSAVGDHAGAPGTEPDAPTGLAGYALELPRDPSSDPRPHDSAAARLEAEGFPVQLAGEALLTTDPTGARVRIT